MGGPGLSRIAKAMLYEKAGDSNLVPTAPNIYAPSEGNIHLMKVVATSAQKERWLRPQVAGQTRSCLAMTEPAPGAGADYATGMARIENGTATMFLTDMDQPGICSERSMDAMDNCITGGHGVLRFDNLRTPAHQVLGKMGQGFRYAQIRLAPARLTHCMRWLGQARRDHDIALHCASRRHAFGKLDRTRRRGLHAGRQRHRPAHRPPAHLAHRLAA